MRGISISGLLLCCGCFPYAQINTTATQPGPQPGAEVIARLAVPGEFQVGSVTIHDVTAVAGRVAYADTDSLVIAARQLSAASGDDYAGSEGLLPIRRSQIARLEEKRFSLWKTGVAFGVGVGAIVGTIAGVHQLLGAAGGGPGKPPPPP